MVTVDGLRAGYGDVTVLHDVNLRIGAGRICALLGRNGSGKTTLMRCINGFLKPAAGAISVSGRNISRLRRNEIAGLISLVSQGSHSPFMFSVMELILMGAAARIRIWSSPGAEEKRRAVAICDELGIAGLLNMPYSHLSGGQKQLAMLARALYQAAPVMLLDEPNAHLDFGNQHRMMALVREVVKGRAVTALITLHDPNLALQYADDVVMLRHGKVVASGPTGAVMDDDRLRTALGRNIKLDDTLSGVRVVIPRNIDAIAEPEQA